MTKEVDGLLDLALGVLRETGAQGGEVFLEDHAVFSLSVARDKIEKLEHREVRGAGLRLFDRGRMAFSYTSDLTADGLREAARGAREFLEWSDPDDANRLPEADEPSTPEPDNYDSSLARTDPQEKIRLARRMEESARATDSRVTRVRRSRYKDVIGRIAIANTDGLRRGWPFSRAYISIDLTAESDGHQQSGWHGDFAVRFSQLDAGAVGREAAHRAVQKLGGSPVPTRRANVVLDPMVGGRLLEAISPALHADNVLKAKSLLGPRLGQQVASGKVTLLDDGRISGADRSSPFDSEGLATRCTLLIEGGVLKGFLQSSYTSIRMGAAPTGNARRKSFSAPPRIGPSTLYLQPTGASREYLMAEAGEGFYITELMGLHTIDPISGDFSLGASALALHAGHTGEPVERIAIAGNILDLLGSVAGVATDLKFLPGGGAGSTTLLTDITVSGT